MKSDKFATALLVAVLMITACSKSGKNYEVQALRVTTETVSAEMASAKKHYVGDRKSVV